MKFFGSVAAYTSLACEINQEVREKLNMFNANEDVTGYSYSYSYRMNNTCIPKLMFEYFPIGSINVGWSSKRWK